MFMFKPLLIYFSFIKLDNITVPGEADVREMIDSRELKGDVKNITHQAVDSDYKNWSDYSRGHLFPRSHAANNHQRVSTYTLTNIAPQIQSSNTEWAEQVEIPMLRYIKSSCSLSKNQKAYIVTGVVPGTQWLSITRDQSIPEGINIPSHYWTAFGCTSKKYNKLIGIGCIAAMENFTLQQFPIDQLNEQLSTQYGQNFSVFPGLTVGNIRLKTPFCSVKKRHRKPYVFPSHLLRRYELQLLSRSASARVTRQ